MTGVQTCALPIWSEPDCIGIWKCRAKRSLAANRPIKSSVTSIGSIELTRRRSTGVVKFPAERTELFDGSPDIQEDIEPIELSTEGTLYTYTTQEFPPPLPYKGNRSPDLFRPYVVGFVELSEGVLVETLIVDANPAELRIGQPLVSTTTTLETADGQSLVTFAFRPAGES